MEMEFKMFPDERLDLNEENQAYIRKLKTLKEFKGTKFDNVYTMMASQYISGKIYYHHFNKFITNKNLNLSDNLMNVFSVFDKNYKNDIHELIKSMFLDIEIPKNHIDKNLREMNKICYLIILIRKYAENYTRGKQKSRVFKNILQELKKVIRDKSLSPIVIHRIIEYCDYLHSVDMYFENDFDRTFSMKLFAAKKFNKTIQECKKQLIINSAFVSKGKIENFNENIIKINPNDLDNINLSCKDYEKICPYVYRNDFILFHIYSLLERI
ncbi:hypothetical protein DMUE_5036 [Dictyocoela muelleri]|nr:hypothetical protein DMUE_5036 [Dictyocoela muelleri]